MTREEYLRRKREGTCDSIAVPKIRSKSEYILTMEDVEYFVENNRIDYTEEDYEKFDANFIEVSIDIYKHQVKVTFGKMNEIVYDE